MFVYAAGLVASPLLLAVYWVLYPAYGEIHGADILRDIGAAPDRTAVADVFAFASCFLAVPAALGYLRVLVGRAPWLSRVGSSLLVVGWMAVLASLVLDVAARELSAEPSRFEALYASPAVQALSALASLHIVGGVLIGVALIRTRVVPRWLAVAATLAPVVHLTSNLAGLLWVDVATWVVTAATGIAVLPRLARLVAADEAVPGGEQGRGSPRADADLGVHVLDVT
jgi:hypothetical protein